MHESNSRHYTQSLVNAKCLQDTTVDDMYSIIRLYADSKADMIFFEERSVLSGDIDKTINRVGHLNRLIDDYLETRNDKFLRLRYCQPWGKMIRRGYVEDYRFRFDEVEYSNDYYFSVCTGYYARGIEASNQVLYIYTYRENSLAGVFCSKPNELKTHRGSHGLSLIFSVYFSV